MFPSYTVKRSEDQKTYLYIFLAKLKLCVVKLKFLWHLKELPTCTVLILQISYGCMCAPIVSKDRFACEFALQSDPNFYEVITF